jgi:hypothetical protein
VSGQSEHSEQAAQGHDFAAATAVAEIGPGRYGAVIDPYWGTDGKPNGGYLMVIAARAALAAAGAPHPLAVTASFLRPPDAGETEIAVELLKPGRQATHARATVIQHGQAVLDTLIVVGQVPGGQGGPSWSHIPDPPPAPFEDCLPQPNSRPNSLLERIDFRYDPAAAPRRLPPDALSGPDADQLDARVRARLTLRDGSAPDALTVLMVADILPPTLHNLGLRGWTPTIQMSAYLRAVPVPGPLGVSSATRMLAGGWFDEVAEVYDSANRLVAQSHQLALAPLPR